MLRSHRRAPASARAFPRLSARQWIVLAVALSTAAIVAACAGLPPPEGDAISAADMEKHMTVLADDRMEGREAGTPGYDRAASYVAMQMRYAGLKPAGDAGYLQDVPLRRYRRVDEGAALSLTGPDGAAEDLEFGADYLVFASPTRTESVVDAPVVFVGFGVVAPEFGIDDYAGLDVKGKVVAYLSGAPKSLPSEERAHFGSGTIKGAEAAKRGAVATIAVTTPSREKRFPFARVARVTGGANMTWRAPDDADGVDAGPKDARRWARDIHVIAAFSLASAPKLFAHAAFDADAVMDAAEAEGGVPPRGPLNISARVTQRSTHENVTSANVVGMIRGSDPELRNELVVLSAHLDHIGISQGFEEDQINNGAMDNAAGVAALLEVAAAARDAKFKRTVVFITVTAEEKGLVGADYFARFPSVAGDMVANINLDMPVILYDFKDVIAFGAERSTLGPLVAQAAETAGVALSPDPMPEQGLFTRSDHYRFVQQGVPSVFLVTGFDNGGQEAFTSFLATRYHRPNDDLTAPVNFDAGEKFARVNYEIMRAVADAPVRPLWRDGDFFARLYDGPMETSLE